MTFYKHWPTFWYWCFLKLNNSWVIWKKTKKIKMAHRCTNTFKSNAKCASEKASKLWNTCIPSLLTYLNSPLICLNYVTMNWFKTKCNSSQWGTFQIVLNWSRLSPHIGPNIANKTTWSTQKCCLRWWTCSSKEPKWSLKYLDYT